MMQVKSVVKEANRMNDQKHAEKGAEMAHTPLFTGDYRRDAAVSEGEKAAEASYAIREAIAKLASAGKGK